MASLKELIQRCVSAEAPAIEVGVITETAPLRVTLEDDAKINLSEKSLVIPSGKSPFEKGERIYMLSLRGGKIYYLLDRV